MASEDPCTTGGQGTEPARSLSSDFRLPSESNRRESSFPTLRTLDGSFCFFAVICHAQREVFTIEDLASQCVLRLASFLRLLNKRFTQPVQTDREGRKNAGSIVAAAASRVALDCGLLKPVSMKELM